VSWKMTCRFGPSAKGKLSLRSSLTDSTRPPSSSAMAVHVRAGGRRVCLSVPELVHARDVACMWDGGLLPLGLKKRHESVRRVLDRGKVVIRHAALSRGKRRWSETRGENAYNDHVVRLPASLERLFQHIPDCTKRTLRRSATLSHASIDHALADVHTDDLASVGLEHPRYQTYTDHVEARQRAKQSQARTGAACKVEHDRALWIKRVRATNLLHGSGDVDLGLLVVLRCGLVKECSALAWEKSWPPLWPCEGECVST
jgi:hypothetical protein